MAKRVAFAHVRLWIDFDSYKEACRYIDKEDEKRRNGNLNAKIWDGNGEDIPRRPSKPFGYSGDNEHDYNRYLEYREQLNKYYDAIISRANEADGIYTVVAYGKFRDYNPGW